MAYITGLTRGKKEYTPRFVKAVDDELCIGCGRCMKICARGVLAPKEVDEEDSAKMFCSVARPEELHRLRGLRPDLQEGRVLVRAGGGVRPGPDRTAEAAAAGPAANCAFQGRCGALPRPPAAEADLALVRNHPCYSEEAHHHFARLHLAVAPGCNVQCNYCNRKFDCAAESRPGVTSARLTPDQAVAQRAGGGGGGAGAVGGGDCRPRRSRSPTRSPPSPRWRGCGGWPPTSPSACPPTASRSRTTSAGSPILGVRHVTVTVNMTDPAVGERIYPWIVWRGRRLRGAEASRILSERQLEGIARLVERGVLVKVNAVVIPGVNDLHLPAVVRRVRALGVFAVNLVPLISAPEHGTRYGLSGQRGPTAAELEAVQRACAVDARLMRHCRQCRADAVGRLSHGRAPVLAATRLSAPPPPARDAVEARRAREARRRAVEAARAQAELARSAVLLELAARSDLPAGPQVRVAVATRGDGKVNQHFGHAGEFLVYDVSREGAALVGVRRAEHYCQGGDGDDDALAGTLRALEGCRAVLVAKIGRCPADQLSAAGIEPVTAHAFQPIEAALLAWYRDRGERDLPDAAAGRTGGGGLMLPELHACEEAEDYFGALGVAFEPRVLAAHRLPLLRRFGELLVEIADGQPGADEASLRALARAALQETYGAARAGRPLAPAATPACGGCALASACAPGARQPS